MSGARHVFFAGEIGTPTGGGGDERLKDRYFSQNATCSICLKLSFWIKRQITYENASATGKKMSYGPNIFWVKFLALWYLEVKQVPHENALVARSHTEVQQKPIFSSNQQVQSQKSDDISNGTRRIIDFEKEFQWYNDLRVKVA